MDSLRERLDDSLLRDVLAAATSRGADFGEVFAEHRRGRALRYEDRKVEELTSALDVGAGIRVMTGGRTAYAYTNILTRDALLEAAQVAAAGAQGEATLAPRDLSDRHEPPPQTLERDPFDADKTDLVGLAARADDAARAVSGEVTQVTATYLDGQRETIIANTDGVYVADRRTRTRLAVQVVATRGQVIQTGFDGPGRTIGHELFDEHPPEDIARRAAERAVAMLDSQPSPSGEMPVVIWKGGGGVLFHEACGHGMEGDIVRKDASVYTGRQGDRIGSDLVTCIDDATVDRAWGTFRFDDEGTPAQKTVLFERGVLKDYMTDRRSADLLGVGRSGNGRRQSYAHLPIPRMTNTYLERGEADPDEIIASVERGVLCKAIGGGQVNPATGDFVFGMVEAYLIEGGEVRHALRGANLVGDGPTLLERIDMVADDFEWSQGICGKDGQSAPVGDGSPTLRIARITVGGTA